MLNLCEHTTFNKWNGDTIMLIKHVKIAQAMVANTLGPVTADFFQVMPLGNF